MDRKALGRTGVEVSIVGLGTAFAGIRHANRAPLEYEPGTPSSAEEELAAQVVVAALEEGCTLVDTAPLYGRLGSERAIGRALRLRPDLAADCAVTTKVGRTYEGCDYSGDGVRRSVEQSLERLGLEYLPVVYIHDAMEAPVDRVMASDGALGALRRLQQEGVVGHVGTAANDPQTNALYIETGEFDAAVVPEAWSLLNQLLRERILPAAEKHGVGLVIGTPLERGLLATGPVEGVDYLARRFSPRLLEHVRRIQALCLDYRIPMAAAALQWCTRHPQVAATIPGARLPEEARENARAAGVEIPEEFWQDLEPLVRHWQLGIDR